MQRSQVISLQLSISSHILFIRVIQTQIGIYDYFDKAYCIQIHLTTKTFIFCQGNLSYCAYGCFFCFNRQPVHSS